MAALDARVQGLERPGPAVITPPTAPDILAAMTDPGLFGLTQALLHQLNICALSLGGRSLISSGRHEKRIPPPHIAGYTLFGTCHRENP